MGKKILISLAAVFLLVSSAVGASANGKPPVAEPTFHATPETADLMSMQEIEARANMPKESHIATTLMTYGEFEEMAAKLSNVRVRNFVVDPARKVWVVESRYPGGVATKRGTIANAVAYSVYDAETGAPIGAAYATAK